MPIERKHSFGGLDLRSNILTRPDGSASDCSNVLLDESRNLIKRKEFEELEIPRGVDYPTSQLHPDAKVVGLMEMGDELLLLSYVKLENVDVNGIVQDLHVMKLFRVLSLYPVLLEEIPSQTALPFYHDGIGWISLGLRAFTGSISYSERNGVLYFQGTDPVEGQDIIVPSPTPGDPDITIPGDGLPLLLRYDGHSFHSAGTSDGVEYPQQLSDAGTLAGDNWYVRTFHFYIDNRGNQIYKENRTDILQSSSGTINIPAVTSDLLSPPLLLLSGTFSPSLYAEYCRNSRGGYFIPESSGSFWPFTGTPVYPIVVPCSKVNLRPNTHVYVGPGGSYAIDGGGVIARMLVSEVSDTSVSISGIDIYFEGKWIKAEEYTRPISLPGVAGYPLSSTLMVAYASRYFTYDYKSLLTGQDGGWASARAFHSIPGWITGGFSGVTGTFNVPSPAASIGGSTFGSNPILASNILEDWYAEDVVKMNPPPMIQISEYGGIILGHDGDRVYFGDTSLGSSPDNFSPFNTFSVGKEVQGKIKAIFSNDNFVSIHREFESFYLVGNILTGNFASRSFRRTGIGCSSSGSMLEMNGAAVFSSYRGIHFCSEGGSLEESSDNIEPLFTKDFYQITPDLSRVKGIMDRFSEYLFFYIPGSSGELVLAYSFYFNEWFKLDGMSFKGGALVIQNSKSDHFKKLLYSDGVSLFLPIEGYVDGVDAKYISNYLTAGEPSLEKSWDKMIAFAVGSPNTEFVFNSKLDWGKTPQEISSEDTVIIEDQYCVELKSFSPNEAYSANVEIYSYGTNPLLLNGYEVTFEYDQDDPVGRYEKQK